MFIIKIWYLDWATQWSFLTPTPSSFLTKLWFLFLILTKGCFLHWFFLREREEGLEERKTLMWDTHWLVATFMCPDQAGDRTATEACALDWELNGRPFSPRANALTTGKKFSQGKNSDSVQLSILQVSESKWNVWSYGNYLVTKKNLNLGKTCWVWQHDDRKMAGIWIWGDAAEPLNELISQLPFC